MIFAVTSLPPRGNRPPTSSSSAVAWTKRHPVAGMSVAGVVLVLTVLIVAVSTTANGKTASNNDAGGIAASPPTASTASAGTSSPGPPAGKLSAAPVDRKQAGSESADSLLATLSVKGRAPRTNYSRAQFGPAWTDDNGDPDGHNGCDTRNDILRRDLTGLAIKPGTYGCLVLAGTLRDPYTSKIINFQRGASTSIAVQIDHVVALSDAWQTGAQQWNSARRTDLANDPLNLLAVDGPTNEAKGDGDAATWLPPNKSYRCAYVARQVAVKARYGLWVTQAEHDAIARILARCPGQDAPVESGAPRSSSPTHRTSTHPVTHPQTHARAPHPTSNAAPPPAVTVFANCAALNKVYPHGVGKPGARDHTASGKNPVTNFTINAAVYDANTARDGDKDGIACEEH